jgi:hypothetical protein
MGEHASIYAETVPTRKCSGFSQCDKNHRVYPYKLTKSVTPPAKIRVNPYAHSVTLTILGLSTGYGYCYAYLCVYPVDNSAVATLLVCTN